MYTSILGAQAAQVVGSGAWAVGELIGAVCGGHPMGESYDFKETKTGSGAQSEPNVFRILCELTRSGPA